MRSFNGRLVIESLEPVQHLPGRDAPFDRLVRLLAERDFDAAAIDAPFSVPAKFVPGSHTQLLATIGLLSHGDRPFASGTELVQALALGSLPLFPPKPLRNTEQRWANPQDGRSRINVRSTLWAGARGGAPMTAACLTLLHATAAPIWPWAKTDAGLLVEAFPAAQLQTWRLPYVRYNGTNSVAASAREQIIAALEQRIALDTFRKKLQLSADALDALLCVFAALAVTTDALAVEPDGAAPAEGWIAVHS